VRNACRRHLDDLKHGKKRGLRFEAEAARAIRFFETKLRLSEGQFEGKPLILHESQAFKVGSIFGWKRRDGYPPLPPRLYRGGQGQRQVAARRRHRPLRHDGRRRGRRRDLRGRRDQGPGRHPVPRRGQDGRQVAGPRQPDQAQRRPGREFNLAYLKTGSFFRPISREARKTGSGPRPHFALCDEIHEHPDRGVIEILERGFKFRRQPLLLMITNSGTDRNSICWEEHEHAVKVAAGNIEAKDEDAAYLGEPIDDTTFSYVCALDPATIR
jgi:phage terminase large subunit-like protein